MQFSAESYIKHYTNLLTYTCVFLIYLDIPSKYSTHLDYGELFESSGGGILCVVNINIIL